MTDAPWTIRWGHQALEVEIGFADDGRARLLHLGPLREAAPARRPGVSLPLVEVTATGHGRTWSGNRWTERPSVSGCATAPTTRAATAPGAPSPWNSTTRTPA